MKQRYEWIRSGNEYVYGPYLVRRNFYGKEWVVTDTRDRQVPQTYHPTVADAKTEIKARVIKEREKEAL